MNPFNLRDNTQRLEFNFPLVEKNHFLSVFQHTPFIEEARHYWAELAHYPRVDTNVKIDLPGELINNLPAQLCATRVSFSLLSGLPASLRFSHQSKEKYGFNLHQTSWLFYVQRGDELLWLSDIAPSAYFEQIRKKIFEQIFPDFTDLPTAKQNLINKINHLPDNAKELFLERLRLGYYWSRSCIFDMRLCVPHEILREIDYKFTIELADHMLRPFNIRVVNIESKAKYSEYSELLVVSALQGYIDRLIAIVNSKVKDYQSEYERYTVSRNHHNAFKYPL